MTPSTQDQKEAEKTKKTIFDKVSELHKGTETTFKEIEDEYGQFSVLTAYIKQEAEWFLSLLAKARQESEEAGKREGRVEYIKEKLMQFHKIRLEGGKMDFYFVLSDDLESLIKPALDDIRKQI